MLDALKLIVVKIGSALVTEPGGAPRRAWMESITQDIAALRADGTQIVIVCSGAVSLGRAVLGKGLEPLRLPEKQAAAACGQPLLMQEWRQIFARHSFTPAQILLTLRDTEERRPYLNARNTIATLLDAGLIPIVNENDTTATEMIRYGDNDRLAARVAQMIGADGLVLLSDIDGMYTADPRLDPNAQFLDKIPAITPEIEAMAGPPQTRHGSGGMVTKVQAAKIAIASGVKVAICRGTGDHPLAALRAGGRATWFLSETTPMTARKRWIAGAIQPSGRIVVDAGAVTALQAGNSLLPAGIRSIDGQFGKGETVAILGPDGKIIGKGLSNYDRHDAVRLAGVRSAQIAEVLGYDGPIEFIHRNNLVMERG